MKLVVIHDNIFTNGHGQSLLCIKSIDYVTLCVTKYSWLNILERKHIEFPKICKNNNIGACLYIN